MTSPFLRIALTSRSDIAEKERVLLEIIKIIEKAGAKVSVDAKHCDMPALKAYDQYEELKNFDLAIVIGGDGTILRVVQEMEDFSIPLFTVNRGTLGFLTECEVHDCEKILPELLRGKGVTEERGMLTCRVLRDGKEIMKGHALNEVVISQGAIARVIELKTTVDGTPLTTFRADGIIIATPTGSTAYNLAAGGPILHPHSRETIITPINAHGLGRRPLVVPSVTEIAVEVLHRGNKFNDVKVSLTLDGQSHHELKSGDRIIVTEHPRKVRFLRREEDTFYEALRTKLRWGEY